MKRNWSEPAIIWTGVIGDSGSQKSPAVDFATRIIKERQNKAFSKYKIELEDFKKTFKLWEKSDSTWRRSKSSDQDPPEMPQEPVADRCWCDDVTIEALAALLANQWRGLLVIRDELSGWFDFDRYASGKGGGDPAAKWLEMFGARPIQVDRKGSKMIHVPRAAVCLTGGIPPKCLLRALGEENRDNGLLARVLFALPPRRPKVWTEAEVDPFIEAEVGAVFDRLFEFEPAKDDDGNPKPVEISLSVGGKAAWVEFYNQHGREQAALSGDLAAAWSKLEGYAARLALVVHCVRTAAGDASISGGLVDNRSVDVGVALSRWFCAETKRVYTMFGFTRQNAAPVSKPDLLLRMLEETGKMTVRDIQQKSKRKFSGADEIKNILDNLVDEGRVIREYENKGETPGPQKCWYSKKV